MAAAIRDYPSGPYDFQDSRLFECHHCFENVGPIFEKIDIVSSGTRNPHSIISPDKLQEIFDEISSGKGLGEGIDREIINDGCAQRAHIISHRLAETGISTGKVFATRNSGAFLRDENDDLGSYSWDFHVAPTVLVRRGNKVQMMVIDTNFMENPATVSQWLRKQNQDYPRRFEKLHFTNRHLFKLNPANWEVPSPKDAKRAPYSISYESALKELSDFQSLMRNQNG